MMPVDSEAARAALGSGLLTLCALSITVQTRCVGEEHAHVLYACHRTAPVSATDAYLVTALYHGCTIVADVQG
jgi:hypothetical protein